MTEAPRTKERSGLPAIVYEPIPEDAPAGRCYMCFPPHDAEWRSGSGSLQLCTKVLDRLVAEGKATRQERG